MIKVITININIVNVQDELYMSHGPNLSYGDIITMQLPLSVAGDNMDQKLSPPPSALAFQFVFKCILIWFWVHPQHVEHRSKAFSQDRI